MIRATINESGFAEVKPVVMQDPSLDEVMGAIRDADNIEVVPELARGCKTTFDPELFAHTLLLTNQGYQIVLTENAMSQLVARMRGSRQPATVKFPLVKATVENDYNGARKVALVALATMSDRWAFFRTEELIERVLKVAGKFNFDTDMKVGYANISPIETTVSFETKRVSVADNGDDVATGFSVINSHAGTSSIKINSYILRLVCTNGLTERIAGGIFGENISVRHVSAGMKAWWMRKLWDEKALYLPEVSIKYLTKSSYTTLNYRIDYMLKESIQKTIKKNEQVIQNIERAASTEFSFEDMVRVSKTLMHLIRADEKATRYMLRELEITGINARDLRKLDRYSVERTVNEAVVRYADELGTNGWALANAFNDQPTLERRDVPFEARRIAEEFSSELVRLTATAPQKLLTLKVPTQHRRHVI